VQCVAKVLGKYSIRAALRTALVVGGRSLRVEKVAVRKRGGCRGVYSNVS
jgi:hypothetical protein